VGNNFAEDSFAENNLPKPILPKSSLPEPNSARRKEESFLSKPFLPKHILLKCVSAEVLFAQKDQFCRNAFLPRRIIGEKSISLPKLILVKIRFAEKQIC